MLSLGDIQRQLGLSEWQSRRLIDAIRDILEEEGLLTIAQGKPMQIDSQAIGIIQRAKDLQTKGIALKSIAAVIQSELRSSDFDLLQTENSNVQESAIEMQQSASDESVVISLLKERIEDLKQREADLKSERDRLFTIVEQQGEQLLALAPPADEQGRGEKRSIGRLRGLKLLLTGKL